jgi:hypothetical protein
MSMARMIGVPAALPPGLRPQYQIAFRRTPTRRPEPRASIALAFPEHFFAKRSRTAGLVERLRLTLGSIFGVSQNRTVVAVTHWDSLAEATTEGRHQVEQDVQALNDFLAAYGLVSDDPLIGPLTLAELPSAAPSIAVTGPQDGPAAVQGYVAINAWRQALLQIPREAVDVERAAIMFDIQLGGDDPTFRVIALLHEALRDMTAGRLVRSAMLQGTAVELLVETTIERAWIPAGLDPARLSGALSSGFKNELEQHLGAVLGTKIDLVGRGTPVADWWQLGYAMRNSVVHDGKPPDYESVSDALRSAFEVAAFVGRELESNDATRELRGMLPTERVRSRRYDFLRAED